MVDVVFLLLIFFMLSLGTPLMGSRVALPEAKSGAGLARDARAVVIDAETVQLDGERVEVASLCSLPAEEEIIILAGGEVAYCRVIEVLDLLRSSGHQRVSLATRTVQEP